MPLRQSFAWWTFAGRGIADADLLQRAKAIGYEAVELIGEDLFGAASDAGLAIAAHLGQRSLDCGWNDLANHAGLEAELQDALALAVRHGIPNLIVFSGSRVGSRTDEEGKEHMAAGLARTAPAAEAAGVMLLLEILNSKIDHPGYECDTSTWGLDVCRRVGSPAVKLLYDIYHVQVMEGDLIRTIESSYADFGHYHTAGNPGRHDLDDTQEINWPPVLRAIARTGFAGYVGHEFIPKGDPIAALQAAFDLCRRAEEADPETDKGADDDSR